jgi:two-component system alkaline phosphatase synthesis response regulator PhoP
MNKSAKRVMLVDDDATIVETLEYNLKRHGFETIAFGTGQTALAGLDGNAPDLIILDWMLPDMQGPQICKLIRERRMEVPILMLTGRANPNDVAHGLTSGADDYLAKPFSIVELLARVQALLRRAKGHTRGGRLKVGDLLLDQEAHRVTLREIEVDLSPKEFVLLKVLMENAGKTMSTETLLNQVWGMDFTGDSKTVAVHMRWLRQKLEDDPKYPQLLETVHRAGYRLNPPEMRTGNPLPVTVEGSEATS